MSAPNQGRQSPEPERQSGAQAGTTSDNPNDQGAGEEQSKESLKNLESNPKGPLEDKAAAAASKGPGNASGQEAK
jgi:hypothetical protein